MSLSSASKQFRITTCTNQKQNGRNIPIANELNTCFPLQAEAVIAAAEGGNAERHPGTFTVEQKREAGPPLTRNQEAHVVNERAFLAEDGVMSSHRRYTIFRTATPGSPAPAMQPPVEVRCVDFSHAHTHVMCLFSVTDRPECGGMQCQHQHFSRSLDARCRIWRCQWCGCRRQLFRFNRFTSICVDF